MPSLSTLLSFAALALTPFTSAVPVPQDSASTTTSSVLPTVTAFIGGESSNPSISPDSPVDPSIPSNSSPFASTLTVVQNTLPLTSDGLALPAPSSNLTLKFVTIGHGVQNYTCANSTADSIPKAIGALATLYDVTSLALLQPAVTALIPDAAVNLPMTNFIIPNTPLTIPNVGTFPIIGAHSFLADATPAFFLFQTGQTILAKSLAKISAPKDASKGPESTGAVPWLALSAKDGSVGIELVYRVVTAGGNPPTTCAGLASVISVPYSAAYHFYG